ncbi:hypothetical protein FOCC_FOCC012479 [Frankliniella occidentalis]|nr:hypothetical protein FOCC_FOCC012479 [Frankliniella occidentalis]
MSVRLLVRKSGIHFCEQPCVKKLRSCPSSSWPRCCSLRAAVRPKRFSFDRSARRFPGSTCRGPRRPAARWSRWAPARPPAKLDP